MIPKFMSFVIQFNSICPIKSQTLNDIKKIRTPSDLGLLPNFDASQYSKVASWSINIRNYLTTAAAGQTATKATLWLANWLLIGILYFSIKTLVPKHCL